MFTPVELLGYTASTLVVISLLMSSLLRLRTISLAGALVFGTYGVLIGSVPVVATNIAILTVNSHHLRRLLRDRSRGYFEVVEWPLSGVFMPRFLRHYRPDIARFQPEFDGLTDDHIAFVVLRDAVPVGALLVREQDGAAIIDLDYVTPAHRDFRPAKEVYGPRGPFARRGIRRLRARATTPAHRRYLERIGFVPTGDIWSREVEVSPT